jgi:hypothetical protein
MYKRTMSDTSCEKLVKYTMKAVAKKFSIDYEEIKSTLKKVIKTAREYDESILGMIEQIMEIGNIERPEDLEEFDIEALKMYARIKDIDTADISDRHIRARVWKFIESEFALDEDSEEEDSEEDTDSEEDSESESEEEPEEEIVPVVKQKKKKSPKAPEPAKLQEIVE